jgi:hypothetical protein
MLISGTAQRHPIFFEQLLEHLQAGVDGQI